MYNKNKNLKTENFRYTQKGGSAMGFRKERWINTHSVYQVSVIDALMQGVMEGQSQGV